MDFRATIEKYLPHLGFLAGVGVIALEWRFSRQAGAIIPLRDCYAEVINVAAVAAGFCVTIKSILAALDSAPIIQRMRQKGTLVLMFDYLSCAAHGAIYLCVATLLMKAVSLSADPKKITDVPPHLHALAVDFEPWCQAVWMAGCGCVLGLVIRAGWLFSSVMRRVATDSGDGKDA